MRVGRLVEVVGHTELDRRGGGVARQEHGSEHRLLGIEIVGWDASTDGLQSMDACFFEGLSHGPLPSPI